VRSPDLGDERDHRRRGIGRRQRGGAYESAGQRQGLSRDWKAQSRVGGASDAIRNATKRKLSPPGHTNMNLIVIIIILVLLFGGGGGYYAHSYYGGAGLGGVLGVVLVIVILLWLFGR
jgi:hypothetical protein